VVQYHRQYHRRRRRRRCHYRWESNRTRTERTELEPTFWVEPNRTRTGQLATDVELEQNRTCSHEEPEPNKNPAVWVLKSSRN